MWKPASKLAVGDVIVLPKRHPMSRTIGEVISTAPKTNGHTAVVAKVRSEFPMTKDVCQFNKRLVSMSYPYETKKYSYSSYSGGIEVLDRDLPPEKSSLVMSRSLHEF